jgi:hypothetical protein
MKAAIDTRLVRRIAIAVALVAVLAFDLTKMYGLLGHEMNASSSTTGASVRVLNEPTFEAVQRAPGHRN